MNTKKQKKEVSKFNLEKFEIAKLKNSRFIIGGNISEVDDPVDTNNGNKNDKRGSSDIC